jgi:capsular polysaccharide biosynthesis protein
MSEQELDLRRFLRMLRRYKAIVIGMAVLGLSAGVALTLVYPPLPAATTLVQLPPLTARAISTQVVIAASDPVLAGAVSHTYPDESLQALKNRVQAASVTPSIISITAKGRTPAQAMSAANALADSYVDYIGRNDSAVGKLPAEVLSYATTTVKTPLAVQLLLAGGLGLLLGLLLGATAAVAVGRNRRRLRSRNEIADAVRVPVLASIRSSHPSSAAGWTRLLEDYEPSVADAWGMRRVLDTVSDAPGDDGKSSVTVLSLSTDPAALALGPQLAVFAASQGITTALIITSRSGASQNAALRAACAGQPGQWRRSGQLWVEVQDHDRSGAAPATALDVLVDVIDGRTLQISGMTRTTATVLGVSAGAATTDQLARVAVKAAAAGHRIAGILLADPGSVDLTTGRVPQHSRSARDVQPTRLTGLTTEITL